MCVRARVRVCVYVCVRLRACLCVCVRVFVLYVRECVWGGVEGGLGKGDALSGWLGGCS